MSMWIILRIFIIIMASKLEGSSYFLLIRAYDYKIVHNIATYSQPAVIRFL